jgi:hypothetical protein
MLDVVKVLRARYHKAAAEQETLKYFASRTALLVC